MLPVLKAHPLSPLISLLVRGLPQMQEPVLTFSSSPGMYVPPIQLPLLFFLLHLWDPLGKWEEEGLGG